MKKKISISPAQGLLILIDHYQRMPESKSVLETIERLKKHLLLGGQKPQQGIEIKKILKDPLLNDYEISFSQETIDKDPAKRYFESHLAYETVRDKLTLFPQENLEKFYDCLIYLVSFSTDKNYELVLDGHFKPPENTPLTNADKVNREYNYYLAKIRQGGVLSGRTPDEKEQPGEKEKLELLVKCVYLSVYATSSLNDHLPINIYTSGMYAQKGKIDKKSQDTTRSANKAIMQSEMPLARDDIARAREESAEETPPFVRPADQSTYDKKALWVLANFTRLMHPFSNSISGTTLCQLRTLAYLRNHNAAVMDDHLEEYFTLYTAAMLFMSGGHSLYEYTFPLGIDEVKYEFDDLPGFEQITLHTMFYEGNEGKFDKALKDAINYNKMILHRKENLAELKGDNSLLPIEKLKPALAHLKLAQEIIAVQSKLEVSQTKLKTFAGISKIAVVDAKMELAQKYLDEGKIAEAKKIISELKDEVTPLQSKESAPNEGYELLTSLEKDIQGLLQMKQSVTTQANTQKIDDSIGTKRTQFIKEALQDAKKEELTSPNIDDPTLNSQLQ